MGSNRSEKILSSSSVVVYLIGEELKLNSTMKNYHQHMKKKKPHKFYNTLKPSLLKCFFLASKSKQELLLFTLIISTTLLQTTTSDSSGLWDASDATHHSAAPRYLPSSFSSSSPASYSYFATSNSPSFASSPSTSASLLSSSSSASSSSVAAEQKRDFTATSKQQDSRNSRVCQVNSGESVAIVEIEESRGSDFLQLTNPVELPISGSSADIELKIESETHNYFRIQDKTLRLIRPLDRDAVLKQNSSLLQLQQQPISSIYLQISCLDRRRSSSDEHKKVIIPVLVKLLDLNDNAPKFSAPVYTVQVDELTPINSVIFDQIQAIDLDSANNGLIDYTLASSSNSHLLQVRTTSPTTISLTSTGSSHSPSFLETTDLSRLALTSSTSSSPEEQTPASVPAELTSRVASVRSSDQPTFNLNSEPILNEPIETDSDELLLASLNNTETTPDFDIDTQHPPASDSSPSAAFVDSSSSVNADYFVVRRRSKRASRIQSNYSDKPSRRAQSELWTDLLGPDEVVAPAGTGNLPGPIGQQLAGGSSEGGDILSLNQDSSDYFYLELSPQTGRPLIRLKRQLDYETRRVHQLTILATDRATNKHERLTSSASLIVRVLDGDDQGPAFLLDQSGCATSTLPQTTPSVVTTKTPVTSTITVSQQATDQPAPVSSTFSTVRRGRRSTVNAGELGKLTTLRELSSTTPIAAAAAHHHPKGFKVTEENFDFSDSLGSGNAEDDFNPAEDSDEEESPDDVPSRSAPLRARHLLALPPPNSLINSNHSATIVTPSKQLDPYTCLAPGSQSGMAEYFASVMSGHSDYLLRIAPQAIRARDRDELNSPIRYSFINGTPTNYSSYFMINPLDATIKQIAPLERQFIPRLEIWVQAQEQSVNKLASLAKLSIEVVASDKSPPVLVPNSYAGFVEENSPVGTRVSTSQIETAAPSMALRIRVLDADYNLSRLGSQSQEYSNQLTTSKLIYDFETTSEAFKVNREGIVYVNKWPLDRDQAQQAVHIFQVTARQVGLASSKSVSSPISLNVTLLDLNDNPPVIANSSLIPVKLSASGSALSRYVTTIKAVDPDEGENQRAQFSLVHVSNGGRDRFKIDPESGQLEAIGRFQAGEQFSMTLQVVDSVGRSNQGILELEVVPGPNTGGPQFLPQNSADEQTSSNDNLAARTSSAQHGYSVELSEGVPVHSPVLQLRAIDPENDPITYSIVDGNVNEDFYINSKSGSLYVGKRLDREEVSAYNLIVQARDSGGLASSKQVSILITDINDQNPVFSAQNYTFFVDEGASSIGKILGRVRASDSDSGENGQVIYQLEASSAVSLDTGNQLFSINEQTGEIKLEEALDYERSKSHTLIVSARDKGETPRSSTCSVIIRVQDLQDEAPYFERYFAEVRIGENARDQRLVQVQARDPDSVSEITYVLKSGDPRLFSVDPKSGQVSTTDRGLDYEEAKKHTLLIGIVENSPADEKRDLSELSREISDSLATGLPLNRSPLCRVDVLVQDLNDNPPQFINQPLPVRVQDTVILGTTVTTLSAVDADGSEPNNQIRYELITDSQSLPEQQPATSERCANSFMLDPASGAVSVKSDLKRDTLSECSLLIRAIDLGQIPGPLSSITQLIVYIDHIAKLSASNSMIGFADSQFTVELEENAPPDTLVKVLPIINKQISKQSGDFPIGCEIVSGNDQGKFYVNFDNSQNRDCELRTSRDLIGSKQLDYEQKQRYSLTLRLNTIGGGGGGSSSSARNLLAQVNVHLLDVNDNRPIFQPIARYSHLTQNKFLAAIASDAPSETQVLQLRASDADSPLSNGLISYELLNEHELEGRFKVEPVDGIIRTSRPVEDVLNNRLPLRLKVLARDNPELASNSLDSLAEVIVNLIDDRHRIALVLKDSPTARVLDSKEELLGAIQERTGLITGLEKAESLKLQRNGTLESDVSGTDFWFYLIEPGTFRVVSNDDVRVKNSLFDQRARNSLLDVIGQTLGFTKARIRLPYSMSGMQVKSAGILSRGSAGGYHHLYQGSGNTQTLASGLIWFALSIAIISAIVIIYQCGSWSGYSSKEKKVHKQLRANLSSLGPSNYYQTQSAFPCTKIAPPGVQQQLLDPTNNYTLQSTFSTLSNQQQANQISQKRNSKQASLINEYPNMYHDGSNNNSTASFGAGKEYETQMLKMSVLFDDAHSMEEQNMNLDSNSHFHSKNHPHHHKHQINSRNKL